jgi:NADP-dependent 3-hydroxy acid dehydrogenase YdfG
MSLIHQAAGLASFTVGDTGMPAAITSKITEQSVWFITGCSTGFGHELAKQLLGRGNRVVVTARNTQALTEFAGKENALVQKLDVTDPVKVTAAVQAAETRFGRIDVLVNNAGIGYFAAVEEGEDTEIRRMFDINLFGLAAVTRAVLPGMRKRRHGFIVNFSSIGGLRSFPAIGWYNAVRARRPVGSAMAGSRTAGHPGHPGRTERLSRRLGGPVGR